MDKIKLKADKRELRGRKVKKLRQGDITPSNLYGKGIDSIAIQADSKTLKKVLDEAGETHIVDLEVEGISHPVLISNVQLHPVTGGLLHVDFRQVNLKEKIEAQVPVELVGESPSEKVGNTVVLQLDEIQVEALPSDLPEKFVIDISSLTEVDQVVFVKDLKYDKSKVEIKTDQKLIVVKVEEPQKEEVIEAPPAPVEGGEAASVEGETETPKEEKAQDEVPQGETQE